MIENILSPTHLLLILVVALIVLGPKRLPEAGRGLGSAMYDGLKAASALDVDFVLSIDGDGQADMAELPRFLKPLEDGVADLVLASRFQQEGLVKYHYRFINNFGTQVLTAMLRRFTGLPLTT